MEAVHGSMLLVYGVIAIALLILLITRYKVYPFLVLIIVSLLLGLASGMPMATIVKSFETGNGNTLGHIAVVVGLGTMLGKMMAESGGAERIATTLIDWFGEKNIHWAMMVVAIIVGLPVFFEVGFVLLIPIAFNVAKRTNKSLLLVGLPMVAGLSVVHGLIPPHPAAMLAVQQYHADIGKTIAYGLIVGVPTAIVAGPLFALMINRYIKLPQENALAAQFLNRDDVALSGTPGGANAAPKRELPSFGITLFTVLLPVILMLVGSWADLVFTPKTLPNDLLHFVGNSDVALLIAVLVSFWTFGASRGFNRDQIQKFCGECLAPIAGITLIVGAGGGFGRVLMDSGISKEIVAAATSAHLSPLLFGWLVAALIRLATGSATVAMTTACGIVAPIAAASAIQVKPELLVLATGSGSLIFSHVNDGGFWLIKEYFGMTVGQTFKTWSLLETIISLMGLLLTFALAAVL
ncbi:gluconate:H+ symporter [Paraburkholderia sp. SIMBA_055]|jgi:GntP family gluconate:H+ symporter|uniref:Gluconate transporter n=2 Tax=Paraburkholderia graminis TaxID=60548 RepID=B1G7C5_PARG4|nr:MULTISPECIES: gluconate:H+ symporter [Paraburkholderia]ALE55882.1 permease DsdX [Burkholderia sp. HB1]AXF09113.1 permease DsdX [Paraburkholderia graminis]EDT07970.1 gluconate transporter [Paraburkholderia graminis C4D1M]MDQ0624383.1 GntP family gluconate:H+ symporter [Paraburkholderia graminis]MDR6202661.1 GntP family gluconate:H+ symporter [Paraburkholderia graminis]